VSTRSHPEIAELTANLEARRRLGLGLVEGGPDQLKVLLSLIMGQPLAQGLEAIARSIEGCTRCALAAGRRKIVLGQGPEPACLMFIGEAPGAQEDRQGQPFVGPAGQLLERMLAAVGLRREEVYITNIVKCRPPENRNPRSKEVATCLTFLEAQVRAVAPRAICALGSSAVQTLLATDAPISALRGRWASFRGIPLLPTFHPAFLLRDPARKAEAYKDLKALIGLVPPAERNVS
jgi:DNA polymerase